jgi:exodeoxyribonuclease VII large subunit
VTDLLSESPAQRAISVSDLNRQAKTLLEQGLARLWVEGEISNLARPASGHLYFTLKDESAQLRCAWFRQRQRGPSANLKNGDQMLALGRVSIYEARGDYQMIVEQLEEVGEGELRRRFEALKKNLASEGLFDEAGKQALPVLPSKIGIVTSSSGAAVRDILTVLQRRFPAIPVVIYPTAVQGDFATAQIVDAINVAVERNECDVLIISRGGGSLEDLWQFNEEAVARAIYACPIPTVSAVGHEVDFTIADFVADVRAPTPSGAAELVVPDQAEWARRLEATAARIANLGRRYLEDRFQSLDWLSRRLTQSSPAATVTRQRDWLKNLQLVLAGAVRHDLVSRSRNLESIQSRLLQHSPAVVVQQSISRLQSLQQRLHVAGKNSVSLRQQRLRLAARTLDSVSPLATLDRGYSIISDSNSGQIVTSTNKMAKGATIDAQLADGRLQAQVTKIVRGSSDDA